MLSALGALVGLRPTSAGGTIASKSFPAQFIVDEERISIPKRWFRTPALIVDHTDTTITVRRRVGLDPIFDEDGVVQIRSLVRTDSDLFVRETWLTVHNYRPDDDGSQTWDIEILSGDISDVVENTVAYHYGPASAYVNAGVYEVGNE